MDRRNDGDSFATPAPLADPAAHARPAGRRWIRFVPGQWKTVVIGTALILIAFLVWAIRPVQTPVRNRNAFAGINQPTPVGVAKVSLGDIEVRINALGAVTPLATVTVKPQVSGQLVRIDFTEGQMVREGQVLAEIDPRPYQAALDQANGQLARDQAQLANAQVDLDRYRTLLAQNSIAQQQVATQEALVRQLQGVIKSDQANVEAADINLKYASIKSPVSGRIGLRQVDLGNLLTAGQATGIAVVTELQPISVVFSVPEDAIGDIMGQVRQGAKLTADAYDRAQTKKLTSGTLATVDNQIDPTTGTVKLRAMFDNRNDELFPNQFVNISLLIDVMHNQTVVPASAIQRGAAGTYVFVVNADRTVSMHTVTLAKTANDRVAVASGLMVGDTVVIDGADRLRDGASVQLPGDRPAAATAQGRGQNGANAGRGQGRGGRRGARGGQGAPGGQAAPCGQAAPGEQAGGGGRGGQGGQ